MSEVKPVERPLLMRGFLVVASLKDLKTQTRRLMKPQPSDEIPDDSKHWCLLGESLSLADGRFSRVEEPETVEEWTCPYGAPGDQLWVKETHWRFGIWRKNGLSKSGRQKWKFFAVAHPLGVQFCSLAQTPKRGRQGWHKRPSIFMPRKASRLTIEIKSIRVERLQDITEAAARAEGIREFTKDGQVKKYWWCDPCDGPDRCAWSDLPRTAKEAFQKLWEKISGPDSWKENPWVWVVEFKRLEVVR